MAAAPPDGHTLVVSTSTAMAINPVLYKKVAYDARKDFAPISFYVKSPFILVVNPDLPVNSVPELIKYAKESPSPGDLRLDRHRHRAASGGRIHEAALRPEHDPRPLPQHAAVDLRISWRAT